MSEVINRPENGLEFKDSEQAIQFLNNLTEPTVVVLDFDETLFLRNSTEEYLDCVQPQFLGAILLSAFEKLKLWKFLPKSLRSYDSMDWIRVVLMTLLFPWTILIWKKKARKLAQRYVNQDLLDSARQNPNARVIVATRGFDFIVRPLLSHIPLQVERLVGCRFLKGAVDRQKGKEEMLAQHLTPEEITRSALITDSLDDASLLEIAQYPFLVKWPAAKYVRAMSGAYLPFFYLEKVKRPGQKFLVRVVLKDHFLALLLACTWLSSMPVLHGLGILFLCFSFWSIYEIGYFENDRVAEQYEEKPVLSETYHLYKNNMNPFFPWIVSLMLAIPGIALVNLGNELTWTSALNWNAYANALTWGPFLTGLGLWMGAMVATRLTFSAYNYLDETTRIWLYPFLQFSKYAGFLLVTPISSVGMALLVAQVFVDWVPYMIYRCGGDRKRLKEQILRMFVFLLLTLSAVTVQRDASVILTTQFAVIVAWYAARSLSQVKEIYKNAHFIWD